MKILTFLLDFKVFMKKEYEMSQRLLDDCITADYSEIHLVVPFKVLNYAVYGRKLSSKRNGSFRFQTNGLFLKMNVFHGVVMTTFNYYSVNHQSGLLRDTFSKFSNIF